VFGGQFSIAVTEAEASSWLNLNAAAIKNADIPLENLQTRFRNNQTSLYAEVDTAGITSIGMEVGLVFGIAPDGQISVKAEEMNFGGIGLPGSLKEEFAAQIQRAIDEQLESVSSTYRVTAIRSQDGVLTIQGVVGG
jgi:hypothetical protein